MPSVSWPDEIQELRHKLRTYKIDAKEFFRRLKTCRRKQNPTPRDVLTTPWEMKAAAHEAGLIRASVASDKQPPTPLGRGDTTQKQNRLFKQKE